MPENSYPVLQAVGFYEPFAGSSASSAILILKTKEDKVLYVNKRTSV
jgi:hypothetical protein